MPRATSVPIIPKRKPKKRSNPQFREARLALSDAMRKRAFGEGARFRFF
jgi:hypothetical protein